MTLQELLDLYFSLKHLAPKTKKNYQNIFDTFSKNTGVVNLNDLNENVLITWRSSVLKRASASTWNNYRRHVSAVLKFAKKRSLISVNPIEDVSMSPAPLRKKKTIEVSELTVIIKDLLSDNCTIKNGWFWAICLKTLFYTGMRRRQLVGLRWKDIDITSGTINLGTHTSKTKRSWVIPIDKRLSDDLLYLRRRSMRKLNHMRSISFLDQQVFCSPIFDEENRYAENRLSDTNLTQRIRRIGKKYGVRLSPHRLRHTFGTEVANNMSANEEVPFGIKALQNQLGHTNVSITLEYIEPKMAQLRQIVGSLKSI